MVIGECKITGGWRYKSFSKYIIEKYFTIYIKMKLKYNITYN